MTSKAKEDKHKMSEIDDHILRYFHIKKRLGKGAYGIVWKALEKKTNQTLAVKKIFDAFRDVTDAQRTFREIMFLRAFRHHPNVIQLHHVYRAVNNMDIYLSFEYMESDLHNIIKKGTILKDVHKRYIMYQLINAIKYIHSGNVIHRDLKPSNVLIDSKCRCKLADFGLARSVSNRPVRDASDMGNDTMVEQLLTDYVATRWYRAPEILVASKRYTKGIDMWSLGCILGEMIRGKPLFQGSSTINQIEKIVTALPEITKKDIEAVGAGFGSVLLNKYISTNSITSLDDLLMNAPDDAKILVKSLIVLDPLRRLTAKEALCHKYIEKFRHSIPEMELKSDVLPPFRDDVRLTVPEYRSKLYEICQANDKHNNYNNNSNSVTSIGKQSNNNKKARDASKTNVSRKAESATNLFNKRSSPLDDTRPTRDRSLHKSQARKPTQQDSSSSIEIIKPHRTSSKTFSLNIVNNKKLTSPSIKDTIPKIKTYTTEQQRIEAKLLATVSKIKNDAKLSEKTITSGKEKLQNGEQINTNSASVIAPSSDSCVLKKATVILEKRHSIDCGYSAAETHPQNLKPVVNNDSSLFSKDKNSIFLYKSCSSLLNETNHNSTSQHNSSPERETPSKNHNNDLLKSSQAFTDDSANRKSQCRQTKYDIIPIRGYSGRNYYEQRIKKLEEEIEKHRRDIKAFCTENPKYSDCLTKTPRNAKTTKYTPNQERSRFIGGTNIPSAHAAATLSGSRYLHHHVMRMNGNLSNEHLVEPAAFDFKHAVGGSGDHLSQKPIEIMDVTYRSKYDYKHKTTPTFF